MSVEPDPDRGGAVTLDGSAVAPGGGDASAAAHRPPRAARPRRRPGPAWLPRQHGAWAMLAVPALVGALRSGVEPMHALLAATLLAGYFLFNAAGLAIRSRRWSRHAAPLLTYGALAASLGGGVLLTRPDLVRWAAVYIPLALLSLAFSARRADRALANDAVTILAACLFAAVMEQAGSSPADLEENWVVVALFAYFFGTALYVKTVIRERASRGYHVASVAYHAGWTTFWATSGAVPMRAGTRIAITVLFAVLTARAAWLAGRRLRPVVVGVGEMVASAALFAVLVTW